MIRQIRKVINTCRMERKHVEFQTDDEKLVVNEVQTSKNKKVKKNDDMTDEQLNILENSAMPDSIKKVRRDKGLIERAESSKTILTEDNKQVLND